MKDVRRGMTDSELVEEAARLAEQNARPPCAEIRSPLVQDELESRRHAFRRARNGEETSTMNFLLIWSRVSSGLMPEDVRVCGPRQRSVPARWALPMNPRR